MIYVGGDKKVGYRLATQQSLNYPYEYVQARTGTRFGKNFKAKFLEAVFTVNCIKEDITNDIYVEQATVKTENKSSFYPPGVDPYLSTEDSASIEIQESPTTSISGSATGGGTNFLLDSSENFGSWVEVGSIVTLTNPNRACTVSEVISDDRIDFAETGANITASTNYSIECKSRKSSFNQFANGFAPICGFWTLDVTRDIANDTADTFLLEATDLKHSINNDAVQYGICDTIRFAFPDGIQSEPKNAVPSLGLLAKAYTANVTYVPGYEENGGAVRVSKKASDWFRAWYPNEWLPMMPGDRIRYISLADKWISARRGGNISDYIVLV